MTDYLLVHDAGQWSWFWGKVWGHLTSPVEHPPRLHSMGNVGNVLALDLPGHGPRAGGGKDVPTFDHCVSAVVEAVQNQGLHDLVMVGHGVAAPILLQAATELEDTPKRMVLFAGLIPSEGKSLLDMLPRSSRLAFRAMATVSRMAKKELRIPKPVVNYVYCNDMDPFDVIKIVGHFTPLPLDLFRAKPFLNYAAPRYPVTYVPLRRDRLIPVALQRRMADRLWSVEMAPELDSCHEVMIERPGEVADLLLRYA